MLTRLTIRWDDSMGCYRVTEPNWPGGAVVPAEYHDAEVERLRAALRLALDTLGVCHMVTEGPNAGFRWDDQPWFDEDLIPDPNCAVCKAEAAAREALGEDTNAAR